MKFMITRTLIALPLLITACATPPENEALIAPDVSVWQGKMADETTIENTQPWYQQFEDPTLNSLIDIALEGSPNRNIAAARLAEARGLRRTARSRLFPQLNLGVTERDEQSGFFGENDTFEAGFDASFELDLFGRNRRRVAAADATLNALIADYNDVTRTLVAEIARIYTDFRAAERNLALAQKNTKTLAESLRIINVQQKIGEANLLDVERSQNLLNTTRAQIPEAQRLATANRLALSVLVGQTPEQLDTLLSTPQPIPTHSVLPVLQAPATVLAMRPDIQAAQKLFTAATNTAASEVAALFPQITISGFYGFAEGSLFDATEIWSIAANFAVNLIDFGRIEGQIDAARAQERIAFETYRRTVLAAISEVEIALSDYNNLNQEFIALNQAQQNAEKALQLSKTLYREGEIAFLDVLDAERTFITADRTLVQAKAARTQAVIRLYKSLAFTTQQQLAASSDPEEPPA